MKKNLKTLVIAEVGVNHNGEMSLAKEMIHAAAESGAGAHVPYGTTGTS